MSHEPRDLDARPVAVLGAGTLGRRIALMLATRGPGQLRRGDHYPIILVAGPL